MQNILFDFDGTLFDTDSAHLDAYRSVFEENQLSEFPAYETIQGVKTIDVFFNITGNLNEAQSMAQRKSEIYLDRLNEIKVFVDLDLLERCRTEGHRLFIVSGGRKVSIYGLLKIHHALHLFDGIITSEDYQVSKPDPEPFLTCIKKFSIKGDMMGVEDSISGMESLKRAKIFAVGVHNSSIQSISDLFFNNINIFLKDYILNE